MAARKDATSVPSRAAYAAAPDAPTPPAGVSAGSKLANPMPRPARSDSAAAYAAMKRTVALAPAYPPLAGEPLTAAPLDSRTTRLPGGSGARSAARVHSNAGRTSPSQCRLNVSRSARAVAGSPAARPR